MIPKRKFFRIMPGTKSMYAEECRKGNFIGGDWGMEIDLSDKLPESVREFNDDLIPVFLKFNPEKSKIAAGLACSMLYTICKGMKAGDVVLSPNGQGAYLVGEVISEYHFVPDGTLTHRRSIQWRDKLIDRNEMSQPLKNSTGSIGTVSEITKHADEIESLLAGKAPPPLVASDPDVEDPTVFALEKHLEDFLVHNWAATELGKQYEIFTDEDELVGQQYPTDTGRIDILAVSKDRKKLLVVELKRGRASDRVVGQIQRYMGYVIEELAEPDQTVRGVIIAMEDDLCIRRALKVANNIDFYRYQVSFKLLQG